MRGAIGRRITSCSSRFVGDASARQTLVPFSTFSDGGGGRGRGRGGGGPSRFDLFDSADGSSYGRPDFGAPAPGRPLTDGDRPTPGVGRGRGGPSHSAPVLPSFASFTASVGRGRGGAPPPPPESDSKRPIFFKKEEGPPEPPQRRAPIPSEAVMSEPRLRQPREDVEGAVHELPLGLRGDLAGGGRGMPLRQPVPEAPAQENRHLRERRPPERFRRDSAQKDGEEGSPAHAHGRGGRGRGRESGFRGRGRGRGSGMYGRGGGREGYGRGRDNFGGGRRDGNEAYMDSDAEEDRLFVDDPGDADDEKFANHIGVEKMNMLTEAFEDIASKVLPSPASEQHLDAFHTNCLIEFESEYLMEEFGTNPDIDEKPPVPLREALEKMKPFLMVYEGIKTQEEWEEVMKATMEQVPLLKEIVDYYAGPDRVTAKQQTEELERVAKTIPESTPASVKRFADRAVLTLQSNPGWGFDKKCQFMDKLVREVSQQYK